MTFKEDFKPTKVYNKLVNDVCYNADCLEEFEKQRLVVANPFSYNKSTRTGIVAEFDNGYHLSKEVGIKRNFVTIGMRVWFVEFDEEVEEIYERFGIGLDADHR
jgi:pimeloyl-CoA synthetase